MSNENHDGGPKKRTLLEPTRQLATPVGVEVTYTSGRDPQVVIEFHIDSGPNAGKHIRYYGGSKGKGAEYTQGVLDVLGYDGETPLHLWKPAKQVQIVNNHRKMPALGVPGTPGYKEERDVDNVQFVNHADGSGGNRSLEKMRLAPAEQEAASSELMARLRAARGTPAKPAAIPAAPTAGAAVFGKKDAKLPF